MCGKQEKATNNANTHGHNKQEKTKTKAQRQKSGLKIHVFEFLLVGKPSTVKVKRQPSK